MKNQKRGSTTNIKSTHFSKKFNKVPNFDAPNGGAKKGYHRPALTNSLRQLLIMVVKLKKWPTYITNYSKIYPSESNRFNLTRSPPALLTPKCSMYNC